jgi:hypothetical protein
LIPFAVNLFVFYNHIAEVNPDAKLHPPHRRETFIFNPQFGLDLDRTLERIHDAGELRQYAVSGGVYEPPVVLFDQAVDYLATRGQGSDCRLFVVPHEAAVAVDVGTEDGGELAFHSHPELRESSRRALIVSIWVVRPIFRRLSR